MREWLSRVTKGHLTKLDFSGSTHTMYCIYPDVQDIEDNWNHWIHQHFRVICWIEGTLSLFHCPSFSTSNFSPNPCQPEFCLLSCQCQWPLKTNQDLGDGMHFLGVFFPRGFGSEIEIQQPWAFSFGAFGSPFPSASSPKPAEMCEALVI